MQAHRYHPMKALLPRIIPEALPRVLPEQRTSSVDLGTVPALTLATGPVHAAPRMPYILPSRVVSSAKSTASSSPSSSSALSVADAMSAATPSPLSTSTSTPLGKKAKKKRIRIKTDRRREQCRANQARYRNKQRDQAIVLEDNVVNLREEVVALERHRLSLYRSARFSNAPMQVVLEYFRLFRHGLACRPGVDDAIAVRASSSPTSQQLSDHQQQIAFLRSVMVPDLVFGDALGVDTLVEQWRRYSTFHQDLELELVDTLPMEHSMLANTVAHTIRAWGEITLTITQDTIRHVFPHLERHLRLKRKLIGKRVTYSAVVEFGFNERHKVQRLDFSLDYIASLLDILHNVADVSTVLHQALIVQNSYLCASDSVSTVVAVD